MNLTNLEYLDMDEIKIALDERRERLVQPYLKRTRVKSLERAREIRQKLYESDDPFCPIARCTRLLKKVQTILNGGLGGERDG